MVTRLTHPICIRYNTTNKNESKHFLSLIRFEILLSYFVETDYIISIADNLIFTTKNQKQTPDFDRNYDCKSEISWQGDFSISNFYI